MMNPNGIPRKSQFETIRIIAMAMIVCHHIVLHICNKDISGFNIINSICVSGVNLFILISGYFQIRLRWQSLLNLVYAVLFYSISSFAIYYIFIDDRITVKLLIRTFLPIGSESYWFITAYFYLMLLSPLINTGIENLSNRKLLLICFILFYINCLSSWIFQNSFNPKGYSTMQFIMIYCFGFALRKDILKNFLEKYKFPLLIISLLIVIFMSKYSWRMYYYNDPLVVLMSVSIFNIFKQFSFYSKAVNTIAKSMLAVYLIQENILGVYFYKILGSIYYSVNTSVFTFYISIYILSLFLSSFVIETLRYKLSKTSIIRISDMLNKYIKLDKYVN